VSDAAGTWHGPAVGPKKNRRDGQALTEFNSSAAMNKHVPEI
jgi:hypothetical protein